MNNAWILMKDGQIMNVPRGPVQGGAVGAPNIISDGRFKIKKNIPGIGDIEIDAPNDVPVNDQYLKPGQEIDIDKILPFLKMMEMEEAERKERKKIK